MTAGVQNLWQQKEHKSLPLHHQCLTARGVCGDMLCLVLSRCGAVDSGQTCSLRCHLSKGRRVSFTVPKNCTKALLYANRAYKCFTGKSVVDEYFHTSNCSYYRQKCRSPSDHAYNQITACLTWKFKHKSLKLT